MKKLLLVTIGTSLLEKTIKLDGTPFEPEDFGDVFFNDFSYDNYKNNSYLANGRGKIGEFVRIAGSLNIIDELNKRERDCKNYKYDQDRFPAEISSILLFLQEEKYFEFQNGTITKKGIDVSYDIHFLISDTDRCKFCARAIQYYFNEKIKADAVLFIPDENLHIIDKLSENSADFNDGLQTLLTTINETTKKADVYQEIIFNITAGYKGVIPYMVLAGMCYKNSRIIYLYETSKSIIEIPKLPLNFDIAGWNDNRAFLRILTKTPQVQKIYSTNELLPISEEFRSLFVLSKESISFTPFGNFLHEKYEKAKYEKALSEFGRGYILADLIKDEDKKQKLKAWINNSQNIWYGDNIPETVDHSRGHCQRLLELAAQIVVPINQKHRMPFLTDDELIALTLTLWFHDIGHSGRELIRNFNDETIKKLLLCRDFNNCQYSDISEFPTANRDVHHVLGFIEALKEAENFGFYDASKSLNGKKDWFLDVEYLKPAIYAYLYHRKKMLAIVADKPYTFKFDVSITKEIDKTWSLNGGEIRLHFLAALQAFVDECDNSRERTGNAEFKQRRIRQTEKEIKTEYEKLLKLYQYAIKEKLLTDSIEINSVMQLFRENEDFYSYGELLKESNNFDLEIKINEKKVEDLLNDCIKKHHDINSNPLVYEIATTLNKVVFKLIQNWHFEKSDAYNSVFILPAEGFGAGNNDIFDIYIESNKNALDVSKEQQLPCKTINDYTITYPTDKRKNEGVIGICKQYNIVKSILSDTGISFKCIRWIDANSESIQAKTIDCILKEAEK